VAPTANQVYAWNSTLSNWFPVAQSGGGGGSGTVTSILASTGLTGGTITTTGTVAVDVGTAANKILQVTSTTQYPGVDGFLITNLNMTASNAGGGQLGVAHGGTGNVGLTAHGLAVWEGTNGSMTNVSPGGLNTVLIGQTSADPIFSATMPTVDGFALTNLNAANLSTVPINKGGTAVTSVTTAPTATAFAGWDANSNLSAVNLIDGFTTTASAAGTLTLTVGSTGQQFVTGSTTESVLLPVTSTLVLGQTFTVVNNSSGVVTVKSSGANTVQAMAASTNAVYTCILTSGTTAASWSVAYAAPGISTPVSVANGGTGAATLTAHTVLLGNGASTPTQLALDASTTKVLTSGGSSADPTWSAIPVAGSNKQVIYNNNGAYGGISAMTWDGTNVVFGSIPSLVGGQPVFTVWGADGTNAFAVGSTSGVAHGALVVKPQATYVEIIGAQSNLAAGQDLRIQDGDHSVLMGNTTGGTKTTIAGAVQMSAFGAGSCTFDASGNISSASDVRLKFVLRNFDSGLSSLKGIRPIIYKWRPGSNMETAHEYAGLSAQNVGENIPEAMGTDSRGYHSIQDRALIAALINAVNALNARVEYLEGQR